MDYFPLLTDTIFNNDVSSSTPCIIKLLETISHRVVETSVVIALHCRGKLMICFDSYIVIFLVLWDHGLYVVVTHVLCGVASFMTIDIQLPNAGYAS